MSDVHDPLIPRSQACQMLGDVTRRTLHNWVKAGKLPKPVQLSPRVSGWRLSTLQSLLRRGDRDAVEGLQRLNAALAQYIDDERKYGVDVALSRLAARRAGSEVDA